MEQKQVAVIDVLPNLASQILLLWVIYNNGLEWDMFLKIVSHDILG